MDAPENRLRDVRRGICLNVGSLILLLLSFVLTLYRGDLWVALAILASILAGSLDARWVCSKVKALCTR